MARVTNIRWGASNFGAHREKLPTSVPFRVAILKAMCGVIPTRRDAQIGNHDFCFSERNMSDGFTLISTASSGRTSVQDG